MPTPLSRGTVSVAAGLGILGVSAYAFLALAGRSLGPVALAPLSVLWTLVNAVGPGIFFPFEQEVARAVAERRAHNLGIRPVVLKAALLAATLLLMLGVLVLAFIGPLADVLFRGNRALVVCLLVAVVGLAAEHISRGVFSGSGRFVRYGAQLGVDGGFRLVGAAGCLIFGAHSAAAFGVVLAAAPLVAVAVTIIPPRRLLPVGPPAHWSDITKAIGLLIAGQLLANVVINAGPVAVELLADRSELAAAGIFTSVLVLARVPLFAFAAIQASFLPALARLAALQDRFGFRRRLGQILAIVVAMGTAGVIGGGLFGPWVVRVLFGERFTTTGTQVALLAAASGCYMAASVLAQALVSVRGYVSNVVIWASGTVVFLALLAIDGPVSDRVGWAFFGGAAASLLVAGATMVLRLRRPLQAAEFDTEPGDFSGELG